MKLNKIKRNSNFKRIFFKIPWNFQPYIQVTYVQLYIRIYIHFFPSPWPCLIGSSKRMGRGRAARLKPSHARANRSFQAAAAMALHHFLFWPCHLIYFHLTQCFKKKFKNHEMAFGPTAFATTRKIWRWNIYEWPTL